jgi:hypothetical protein
MRFAGHLMVAVPAIAVEVLRNTSTAFIGVAAHTMYAATLDIVLVLEALDTTRRAWREMTCAA